MILKKFQFFTFTRSWVCAKSVSHFYSISAANSKDWKLGFLGTGRIAQAIILGLIDQNKVKAEQIFVSDANLDYLKYLKERCPKFRTLNINYMENNLEILKNARTILLCVKPKDIPGLLNQVSSCVHKDHLIVSLAAGIQIKNIEKHLPRESRVVRIMPNLAALVQQSVSLYSRGSNATKEDGLVVKKLLESVGYCEDEIDEDLMNVVTALSGSGPAYMCVVLDALAEGAVKMGMSRQLALSLATRTMAGSANMIINELNKEGQGKHIMNIKEEISSPGGTTIFGLSELERYNIRHAFGKCIETATNRAKELNRIN